MEPSHPYRGKMVAERARGRPAVSAPTGSEGEISASINYVCLIICLNPEKMVKRIFLRILNLEKYLF